MSDQLFDIIFGTAIAVIIIISVAVIVGRILELFGIIGG